MALLPLLVVKVNGCLATMNWPAPVTKASMLHRLLKNLPVSDVEMASASWMQMIHSDSPEERQVIKEHSFYFAAIRICCLWWRFWNGSDQYWIERYSEHLIDMLLSSHEKPSNVSEGFFMSTSCISFSRYLPAQLLPDVYFTTMGLQLPARRSILHIDWSSF